MSHVNEASVTPNLKNGVSSRRTNLVIKGVELSASTRTLRESTGPGGCISCQWPIYGALSISEIRILRLKEAHGIVQAEHDMGRTET